MAKGKRRSARQPTAFFPPLAAQQSVWDSITNGNFVDAKIFAFSRRSREPGRVDTPKALFVNIHILATACSYFQSTFSFSDGFQTHLNAELPPDVEPFSDLEDCDLDSDFDDPVEGDSVGPQPQDSSDTSKSPQKSVRTYVVKYTAYRTLRAIIWYIYSGEIAFSGGSPRTHGASAKSVYRFADEHRMDDLKALASEAIVSSIDQLSPSELVEEALSVSTSRYPELRRVFVERLPPALSRDSEAKLAFEEKLSAYFRGDLPHCKEIITSTLLYLLDKNTIHNICDGPADGYNTISRVSCPWPGRTREALRVSLDNGTFDNFALTIVSGPAAPTYSVYFATVVMDDGVCSSFWRSSLPFARQSNLSLSTWLAIAYYTYTRCITFKLLGPENIEPSTGHSPSDTQFRGCPCSTKEVFSLARKLVCLELMDLATTEMMSSITPENVVEETFYGLPPPPEVVARGVEIICSPGSRDNPHTQSRLREILEEAAAGSRLNDLSAFSMCFNKLL